MPTDRECYSCPMGKFEQIPQKYAIDSKLQCNQPLDYSQQPWANHNCNQQPPYYKLGPNIKIVDKAKYIYIMPNQQVIGGGKVCKINPKLYPWYGLP